MPRRAGLTLLELLIVVAVATLLLAAAVPLLRLPLQGRKVREAAREVHLFLTQARARAVELGRPVGVLIRRADPAFPNGSFFSQQLYLVESPPPYAGDDSNARAVIPSPTLNVPFSAQLNNSALAPLLISVGDLIQFDFQQPLYRITMLSQPDPTNQPDVVDVQFAPLRVTSATPPPPPASLPGGGQRPVPYQIFRSPIRLGGISATGQTVIRTSGAPLDLPNGVVIDLTVSGMEPHLNQFTAADPNDADPWTPSTVPDTTDVVILFGPSGQVEQVYHGLYITLSGNLQTVGIDPPGMIYLLIGRLDQVVPNDPFARGPDQFANLMDSGNLWIVVSPQTGKISTVENASLEAFVPPPGTPIPPGAKPGLLRTARQFASGPTDIGG